MVNKALYVTEMKNSWKLLLIFCLILTMYTTIMLTMFDPSLGSALDEFAKMMPEIMSMVGMNGSTATLVHFLSTYLYGMLMIVFPFLFTVLLSLKYIAKKVDNGSMAYLLSSGSTRGCVWRTECFVLLTNLLLLIVYCTLLGLVCSSFMFPQDLDVAAYLRLNFGVLCLHMALAGISFLFSCICNEYRQAATFGAGFGIYFILVQMLANMKGNLENMKYATLMTLFDRDALIVNAAKGWYMSGILLLIAIGCFSAANVLFQRKNMSL